MKLSKNMMNKEGATTYAFKLLKVAEIKDFRQRFGVLIALNLGVIQRCDDCPVFFNI
jgi:hypothetical protein